MKMVTTKRIGWVAPIMALTLGITSMNVATAQNKPKAKATKAIKTEQNPKRFTAHFLRQAQRESKSKAIKKK